MTPLDRPGPTPTRLGVRACVVSSGRTPIRLVHETPGGSPPAGVAVRVNSQPTDRPERLTRQERAQQKAENGGIDGRATRVGFATPRSAHQARVRLWPGVALGVRSGSAGAFIVRLRLRQRSCVLCSPPHRPEPRGPE